MPFRLTGLSGLYLEADPSARRSRRAHQLADGFEERSDVPVVACDLAFQFREFFRQHPVRGKDFSQPDKGPHHVHTHVDGARTVEHIGSHDGPVFGKRVGTIPPRLLFEVAICDLKDSASSSVS